MLRRAADQSLAGIVANDPGEAVYLVYREDVDGRPLEGGARYELRFTAPELPPVDAFWSLTMYEADMNLVPNTIGRHSIGDRSPRRPRCGRRGDDRHPGRAAGRRS